MSFPRYPEYKDSGVAWLGDVPAHWGVQQGRRLYSQKRDSALPGDEQLSATQKYGVVPQRLFMEMEDQKVTLALSGLDNFKHVEVDDFVISLRSFQGGIERSKYSGCVSPAYTVLRPAIPVDASYMGYVLKSSGYIAALQSVTDGIRDGKNISYEQFGQIGVPCPSHVEQTAISTFLDRETAKIDALVAEQERLIALLKEKRQAVISHAVTKGLDPDVPMKGSGIEWLGEVPAHWKTYLLKRAFRSIDYGISDSLNSEGTVAILRMGNIQDGKIVIDDMKYTDHVDPSLFLQAGDLLYNRTNSLDLIGKVGMFVEYGDAPVSFASYLVRLRTIEESIPEYFAYLLNTEGILGLARSNAFVAIGQCNLNPTRYGQITIAIPPRAEQAAIAEYLNAETSKLDALTAEAKRAIELLKERRSALISAAVTGKVDVRSTVSQPAQGLQELAGMPA